MASVRRARVGAPPAGGVGFNRNPLKRWAIFPLVEGSALDPSTGELGAISLTRSNQQSSDCSVMTALTSIRTAMTEVSE